VNLPVDSSVLNNWRKAAQRGGRWLKGQIDLRLGTRDPLTEINWFSKAPWALLACGERARAMSLLRQSARHLESPNILEQAETLRGTNALPYALGWLISAARRGEDHDVAEALYTLLRTYIDGDTGGVLGRRADRAARQGEIFFDAALQGAGLHAAVAMGDRESAERIGKLLIHQIETQPDRSRGFYMLFSPSRGHLTACENGNISERLLACGAPRQPFANLGFALQGLCRCSEMTGDTSYAVAAAVALDDLLNEGFRQDLLTHGQNHKVAHAAILLYGRLRDLRYLHTALQIASLTAQRIQGDGRAWGDVFFSELSSQTELFSVRTTCDSVLWLHSIADEIDLLNQQAHKKEN
jgi:hypothetical protein